MTDAGVREYVRLLHRWAKLNIQLMVHCVGTQGFYDQDLTDMTMLVQLCDDTEEGVLV